MVRVTGVQRARVLDEASSCVQTEGGRVFGVALGIPGLHVVTLAIPPPHSALFVLIMRAVYSSDTLREAILMLIHAAIQRSSSCNCQSSIKKYPEKHYSKRPINRGWLVRPANCMPNRMVYTLLASLFLRCLQYPSATVNLAIV